MKRNPKYEVIVSSEKKDGRIQLQKMTNLQANRPTDLAECFTDSTDLADLKESLAWIYDCQPIKDRDISWMQIPNGYLAQILMYD